jgi:hypothetical protein
VITVEVSERKGGCQRCKSGKNQVYAVCISAYPETLPRSLHHMMYVEVCGRCLYEMVRDGWVVKVEMGGEG